MHYNHKPDSDRRRLCLENIPGMYNMSCTQLLALANTGGTSASVGADSQVSVDSWVNSWKMESNSWILNPGSSLGINTGIAGEKTMEKPQCDVSTPQKFFCDLNLTPEEIMSTSQRPTKPEFSPITLDTPGERLPETDQEPHVPIKKPLHETGSPARRKRAGDDKLKLITPRQIQKRKKIRPKVVREGDTKRSRPKSGVKKAASVTTPAAKMSEDNTYVRPKRSTRRSLIFDYDVQEEDEYRGLIFTPEVHIGASLDGELVSNPTMQIFGNIPKRRRQSMTSLTVETLEEDSMGSDVTGRENLSMSWLQFPSIPRKRRTDGSKYAIRNPSTSVAPTKDIISEERICQHTETLSLFNTLPEIFMEAEGNLLSDSYISQNNHKKFGRKRSSIVTRPRNFRSLKRLFEGIVPVKREKKGYRTSLRPTQLKAIVIKMQSVVCRKKRSNRDPIASKLNAKLLHMQWQRQNSTGTSTEEIWKRRFSIDTITKLLQELDINRENLCPPQNRETAIILHQKTIQGQKAVVQYRRDGSIVPFTDEKKYQPKVKLDDETNRVWKLLMVSINSEGVDGLDDDNKKWWEEEREAFYGRANAFIGRMRLVQGDRRFSPWKGSVVDSVVGVFLTQNVADHSSSSAFMDIAAEFPINEGSCHEEWGSSVTQETVMNLDSGKISNPTCIIIHEIDDEEDIDAACSKESSKSSDSSISSTNQSEMILFETVFGSEAKEIVNCDEDERACSVRRAEAKETVTFDEDERVCSVRKAEDKALNGKNKTKPTTSKKKGQPAKNKQKESFDWDSFRRQAEIGGQKREITESTMDTVDWDALRCTDVKKIAAIIRKRGMNNMLSERIKAFLNRLVYDHGSINLEWLRDVPPDKAKEYLLSINGLGLKSVECVRLLSLYQIAFPVDTNVGRIAVRLGWVPLQPLPDELQMHLLELYPVLESVQKYLWPRLCKLDQKTLYELHYHMITFGKVFCTKVKPNCNACPMKAECRHYASARASAHLALPESEEGTNVIIHERSYNTKPAVVNFRQSLFLNQEKETRRSQNCEPIIEEPASPEPERVIHDIEDYPWENYYKSCTIIEGGTSKDPSAESMDEISTIILHKKACIAKDLVVLSTQASSIPTHKLKNVEKLRTEHYVYELPDSHHILEGFEKRELEDKLPYLLAIWTPGETPNSIKPPERRCVSQESDTSCREKTCYSCNSRREEMSQIVRGTILIPCRTAMRGGFPLNGTYFQTNEVFADHGSSINPIDVPRECIWDLPRKVAYFGSSVSAIFGGLSVEAIQYGFWRGYVCVRGFDREDRRSQTLVKRLHCPPSKQNQEDEE